MHFLLFYDFVADYVDRRGEFRLAHLEHAWAAQRRGELLLAGALADPVDRGVLLFQGEQDSVARDFAVRDPYVKAGLVTRWEVRAWTTVVGEDASVPMAVAVQDGAAVP